MTPRRLIPIALFLNSNSAQSSQTKHEYGCGKKRMDFAADKTSSQSANKIRKLDRHLSATGQWEQELEATKKDCAELAI